MFSFLKSKQVSGFVGLEIRPDGLAIAVLNKSSEPPELKYFFKPCNAAEREQVLTSLVEELSLQGMSCQAVLPFDQYKTYPIDKPQVEDSELADAARWRIKDMLDFELDDAVSDVYPYPADALRGRPEQLNVVVCRKVIIETIVKLVQQSGLELISIDIGDLALRNICLVHAHDPERPVAILYLRRGAGSMVFVKQSQLYLARHFEFSIEALTDSSTQDNVIQNLALEIQRSFDYFESQLGQIPPQELALIGPDPSIPLANMLGGSIGAKVVSVNLPAIHGGDIHEAINSLLAIGAVLKQDEES